MRTLDTRGQKCPLPLLKLEKAINACKKGEIITLIADDPIAIIDIGLFCKKKSYECKTQKISNIFTFTITKS
jgi:tRNA 2-thiouridine synthesizing protein A